MAATKGTKKAAKKGGTKKAAKKGAIIPIPGRGPHPLYGRPIDQAIARGDIAAMRRLSTQAKSYLRQLQTAMKTLDNRIGKTGA